MTTNFCKKPYRRTTNLHHSSLLFGALALMLFLTNVKLKAADWDNIKVPANPGPDKEWKLLDVSDDFSYEAKPTNKPKEFTKRWVDWYINPWTGPGRSEWNREHSWVTDGKLVIASNRKEGTDKVYVGCISSKKTYKYPLFIEGKLKMNKLPHSSNLWLLSPDSTQEIDAHEAYGSDRKDQDWYANRIHISHHVFIRKPLQDYQPMDDGSWFNDGTTWNKNFHRAGVFWKDPWNLEYYIDGKLVRTVSGKDIIDPKGFTDGTGLNKAMHIIINTEDQDWRSNAGDFATNEELADDEKSTMWVDWVRVYQAVEKSDKASDDSAAAGKTKRDIAGLGELRKWTDREGQRSFSAKLVAVDSGWALLEKEDGSQISLQFEKFSEEDQKILKALPAKSTKH